MSSIDTKFDLAILALKGKRYAEAEQLYTTIATEQNSPEAWVGLGFCKLNQLAEGRTIQEVTYCLNKAISINPSIREKVENQFIGNCVVLLSIFINSFDQAIAKDRALKKKAAIGAILTGISVYSGFNSKSTFGMLASFAGAGAGIGIAVESLNKIQSVNEFKSYLITTCNLVNEEVKAFVNPTNARLIEYETFIRQLVSCIEFKSRMNIPIGNEDLIRYSYLSNNISMLSFSNFKQNEAYKKELASIRSKYEIDALEGGKLTVEFKKTPLHS